MEQPIWNRDEIIGQIQALYLNENLVGYSTFGGYGQSFTVSNNTVPHTIDRMSFEYET